MEWERGMLSESSSAWLCLVVLGDLVDEVLKDKAVLPLRDISSLSYFDMGNSSRRIRNGDWLLVIFK